MMMVMMIMMTTVVMITRHLDMECEVSKHRRLILLEVKKRKEREKREEEARKIQMKIEKERQMMMMMTHDRTSSDVLDSSGCGAVGVNNEMNNDNNMIVVSKMKMCLQCNIEVKESMLPTHMTEQCTHRLILCPNYSMGCKEKFIVLNTVQQHLMHECQLEKHRDVMVAKSKHRRGKAL